MTTTTHTARRWFLGFCVAALVGVLLALAVAVILIAIPLTRQLLLTSLGAWLLGGRLESLAVDLDLQPGLRWIFVALVLLPLSFGIDRVLRSRDLRSGARGLLLSMVVLLALGLVSWWQTRHFNFDAQGRPTAYLSFRRDGVHKSFYPGVDRVTGRTKYPVTLGRVAWLSELARQPVVAMDPAVMTNWFDANSGEANLWFLECATNQWQFFNRPHFHQQLAVEVEPITCELMQRWQQEQRRRAQLVEDERQRREVSARAQAAKEAAEARVAAERRQLAEQARQTAARKAAAEEAERGRLQAEAEAQHQREEVVAKRAERLQARRTREAAASPAELEVLDCGRLLAEVCPDLSAASFLAQACEEEYLQRRFRIQDTPAHVKSSTRFVTLPLRTYGGLHCVAVVTMTPDAIGHLRAKKPCTLAATLISVRLSSNVTNLNGVTGFICWLEFGNGTVVDANPAYRIVTQPKPVPARKSDPYFTPLSSFSSNPPLGAALGFTFENGVNLAFSPFALLNKALGGDHSRTSHSQTSAGGSTHP